MVYFLVAKMSNIVNKIKGSNNFLLVIFLVLNFFLEKVKGFVLHFFKSVIGGFFFIRLIPITCYMYAFD